MDSVRKCLAYIGLHTFGMKLLYPGTCWCMPRILGLNERRMELFTEYGCECRKIRTQDKNIIDTIFLDHRNQGDHGDTLVICCEGSASFYEDGCLVKVPMDCGYSVIGWNHPGFGNSTGTPTPTQEQNAIEAVMHYAIYKLGFKKKNILIYGWSIGSYTASYAAMTFPKVKGVILDAPFDKIDELARCYMPNWLKTTVDVAVKNYVDLNVSEQLVKYQGPILLIRRTRDEVLTTNEFDLLTNRVCHLLIDLLKYRYPELMTEKVLNLLRHYLSLPGTFQKNLLKKYRVDEFTCKLALQQHTIEHSQKYPMDIGKEFSDRQKQTMILYLASKYMVDFDAPHCRPLPMELFEEPWQFKIEK